MAVEDEIVDYLNEIGESATTREIAEAISRNLDYVRKKAKDLREHGIISGEKSIDIPGCIIENGDNNLEILTNDRDYLMDIIKKYNPSLLGLAQDKTNKEIRKLITEEICDRVVIVGNAWEFWAQSLKSTV